MFDMLSLFILDYLPCFDILCLYETIVFVQYKLLYELAMTGSVNL